MLIAVDTGGTKTLVAAFKADGTIAHSTKFPTPTDFDEYLSTLLSTIGSIAGDQPVEAISIALPGTITNDIVAWCSNLPWKNVDILSPLAKVYPEADLFLENDANLAGLGETRMRSAPVRSSLYVTFSTGIGAGVITDGDIDPYFRVSEAGHSVIEYNDEFMKWESFASGRAIYRTFGRYARDIDDEATWRDIADRMSRGLLILLPFMRPDILIIGGSMGSYFDRYGDYLRELLDERLHHELMLPEIVGATHPEEAVIYGCYYYALDHVAAPAM